MSTQEKKMDGAMRIFEALSGVDEELLVRCEDTASGSTGVVKVATGKTIRPVWYYGKVLAACLCFVIMGVLVWAARPMLKTSKDSATGNMQMAPATAVEAPLEMEEEIYAMPESATEQQRTEAAGAFDNGTVDYGQNQSTATTDGKLEDKDTTSVNKNAQIESLKQEAAIKDLQGSMSENGQESISSDVLSNGVPLEARRKMTLQEASDITVFGEYIPKVLPVGYTFAEAWLTETAATGEAECITLRWSKGMDDINIMISHATTDIAVVDIGKPETYNVHLYEIPYAATVPEVYRTVFDNPVFAEKDFTSAVVEARMKVVADAGDTDTPRGNFAVLYDSGVLVTFRGDGDAESIYEMMASVQ